VDCLLIPSRFEPCGLTQLYALKYGTLPLVRKTGGLADTVFETGDAANGFVFERADTQSLIDTLHRAMDCFNHSQAWRQRQINGMKYDFSWQKTTDTWLNLYQSLLD
jgi:starch synthase